MYVIYVYMNLCDIISKLKCIVMYYMILYYITLYSIYIYIYDIYNPFPSECFPNKNWVSFVKNMIHPSLKKNIC